MDWEKGAMDLSGGPHLLWLPVVMSEPFAIRSTKESSRIQTQGHHQRDRGPCLPTCNHGADNMCTVFAN